MVRLTVLGGAGEIGGNKILLEDGDRRLLLDFGISFARRSRFFEEYLAPRAAAGLADLIVTGVLPAATGLYRQDLLAIGGPGVPAPHAEPAVGALLLSHAHLDHAGHLGFLDARIPTYCSAPSHGVLSVLQGVRGRAFESEFLDYLERPAFRDLRAAVGRRFELVDGEFAAGGFACRALPVDHSIPGSLAFLVRTSRGNVLYTGDVRFHGPDAADSEAMLQAAGREGVWLLLTEGTRLDVLDRRTEDDVYRECLAAVAETAGSMIADFAPRDVSRMRTFLRVARETDRVLVITAQDAYLLETLHDVDPRVPDLRREPILVLKERKQTGTYSERDYPRWERRVLARPSARTAGELRPMRDRCLLALGFWDVQNLADIGAGRDALYIRSASEAYTEEQAADERRMHNWLALLGVRRHLYSHASGHAPQPDLVRMVRALGPEVLVPVHTEVPRLWRDLLPEVAVIEPTPGVPLEW
ncbi:MAG: MBL fold metallo-hydrolase [Armatimonadota bacterium]|nr:MBL fold metallo-hydrolase [Armatimonadota bacterium]